MSENTYGLPDVLSAQAIYDKVATHLFRQGRPSMMGDGVTCAYRGEGGTACAIGCLIDDDDYLKDIESMTVAQLYDPDHSGHIHNPLPKMMRPYLGLMSRLQSVHDSSHNTAQDKKSFLIKSLAYSLVSVAQTQDPPLDPKIALEELEKRSKKSGDLEC